MAFAHIAKDLQAELFLPISSISNYGFLVRTLSFLNNASLFTSESLSNYLSLSKNPISFITFLAPSQSAFYSRSIQTA